MALFDEVIQDLFAEEGGLHNDTNDLGGLTNFGISQKSFPDVDIAGLTAESAAEMYRLHYWEPLQCDSLLPMVACVVFIAAVNEGVGTAAMQLQSDVGVTQDGVIGNATIAAVNAFIAQHNAYQLCEMFNVNCIQRYVTLKDYPTFGKGWITRIVRVYRKAILLPTA